MENKITHLSYMNKKVFLGLDGLRFFSIFAVVWHHSVNYTQLMSFFGRGFLGVDLFFVISGFLIVTLLLRERDKKGTISLKNFYIRRGLRIVPLYYAFILVFFLYYSFFAKNSTLSSRFLQEVPIYLLYLSNLFPVAMGVFWSLAAEQQFYFVWPILEKYVKKYILYIILMFIALNQYVNFKGQKLLEWLHVSSYPDLHIVQITFTPIILGVALAHLLHHSRSFNFIKHVIAAKYSSLLFIVLLLFLCFFSPLDISGLPRFTIQLLMVFLVGSIVVNEENKLTPILTFSPVVRIGVISYGIYLFHIQSIEIAKKLLKISNFSGSFLVFILGFFISIMISEISYRFFETPFLKMKVKF